MTILCHLVQFKLHTIELLFMNTIAQLTELRSKFTCMQLSVSSVESSLSPPHYNLIPASMVAELRGSALGNVYQSASTGNNT